MEEDLRKSFIL